LIKNYINKNYHEKVQKNLKKNILNFNNKFNYVNNERSYKFWVNFIRVTDCIYRILIKFILINLRYFFWWYGKFTSANIFHINIF